MEHFDVFRSDGGWRVCGGIWAGGPILRQSPWFADEAQAKAVARQMRFNSDTYNMGVFREGDAWIASWHDEYHSFSNRKAAVEAVRSQIRAKGWTDSDIDYLGRKCWL